MKPYLFGYYYDWFAARHFHVEAIVMADTPEQAAQKYESDSDCAYGMGEINLVGGAVWEAREAKVIQ